MACDGMAASGGELHGPLKSKGQGIRYGHLAGPHGRLYQERDHKPHCPQLEEELLKDNVSLSLLSTDVCQHSQELPLWAPSLAQPWLPKPLLGPDSLLPAQRGSRWPSAWLRLPVIGADLPLACTTGDFNNYIGNCVSLPSGQ